MWSAYIGLTGHALNVTWPWAALGRGSRGWEEKDSEQRFFFFNHIASVQAHKPRVVACARAIRRCPIEGDGGGLTA